VFDGDLYINGGYPSSGGYTLEDMGGVQCITGSLYLFGTSYEDLALLSSLRQIGGTFAVGNNASLTSLHGLENLTSVGGSLSIGYNPALTTLSALGNLTSLNAQNPNPGATPLTIIDNASLPGCWVWMIEEQTNTPCTSYAYPGPGLCTGNTGAGTCQ
jgi:hypothetical protein